MNWEAQKLGLFKEAAAELRRAADMIVEGQKTASDHVAVVTSDERLQKLASIYADLKYVELVNALQEGFAKEAAATEGKVPHSIENPGGHLASNVGFGAGMGALAGAGVGALGGMAATEIG